MGAAAYWDFLSEGAAAHGSVLLLLLLLLLLVVVVVGGEKLLHWPSYRCGDSLTIANAPSSAVMQTDSARPTCARM